MKTTDIFYFDVDGTLLDNENHSISEKTLFSLKRLKEMGYKVALCTGRTYPGIHEAKVDSLIDWDGYVLANGSTVLDKNKNYIYQTHVDIDTIHYIQDHIGDKALLLEGDENFLTRKAHEPILRALKHFGVDEEYEIIPYTDQKVYNVMCYEPLNDQVLTDIKTKVQILYDQLGNYELIPIDSGKDIGIQKLNEIYDINHHVVFGDGDNDYTMLKYADISIAMGNAEEKIKNVADYITESVNNDGIYKALVKFGIFERNEFYERK